VESPQYFLAQKDFGNKADYEKGFSFQELFPANSVGIVTARDEFTIHETEETLKETIVEFLSLDNETARVKFNLGKDARDWSVEGARKDLVPNPAKELNPNFDKIVKISYRPFDIRYTYYTGHSKGFHCMPRGGIMRHFIVGENIGLLIGRQGQVVGTMPWNLIFITENITDFNMYYRGGCAAFPLYLYPFDDQNERTPNLDKDIVTVFSEIISLPFIAEKQDNENSFAPIDLLDYIYAVLYSNNYRAKYKEFLKIDFPRIPYPENAEQFQKLVSIGSLLRRLHLMENVRPAIDLADFPVAGTNEIETVNYKEERIYVNKHQYFENVPPEIWGYYIGGYQPAEKWLKDRKGQVLSFEDIEHYQKIITVLKMTIELQAQIDEEMQNV
jgi:predicted helicase